MLYVNKRFISNILSNEVLSVIVIFFPIVMPNWVLLLLRLRDLAQDVWLNFAECEERHHSHTPSNPIRTSESIASYFGNSAFMSFDE
jgi:hypothetical protein